MAFNYSTNNFYTGLQTWDGLKITIVVLNIFIILIGPFLLYSVIWYERFSSDLMHRTLINQLLSHLCFIEILSCFFSRLSFFSSYCFGPLPTGICDFSTLLSRYGLVLTMNEITIRQLIKFLYVFKWRYLAHLHADFSAHFFTLLNIVLGLTLALATYFLGFHNEELDYHVCTGRMPTENVVSVLNQMGLKNISNSSSAGWLKEVYGRDPLDFYVKCLSIVLLILVVQIWACIKIKCFKLFYGNGVQCALFDFSKLELIVIKIDCYKFDYKFNPIKLVFNIITPNLL